MYTIETLRILIAHNLTSSPRKTNYPLKCAVLTKGRLKPTAKGDKMFTMTLCDANPNSTVKASCFHEKYYDILQPLETYIFTGYKAKTGFAGSTMQINMDSSTQIEKSATQYKLERSTFSIAQVLRKETQHVKMLNIRCKITNIDEVKTVGQKPKQFLKIVAQQSACLVQNSINTHFSGIILRFFRKMV